MNKRIEPGLFSSAPDIDQVEDSKKSVTQPSSSPSNQNKAHSTPSTSNKQSSLMMWLGIISVVTLAAGGFTLHKQHLETKAQLEASEQRIAELERTLSATGEEMGESAGAIRAKLTAVSERTDELWTQMDKLWASAWRRNQSEIKSLKEQTTKIASSQTKASKDASTKINSLSQTQTEQALKLSFLEEQQQAANAIKDQLATLTTSLDQLKAQSKNRDNKQVEIGASLAQLEMTQSALAEQLERLSNRLSTASSAQQTSN